MSATCHNAWDTLIIEYRLEKPKRSVHIHDCVRKATARRLGIAADQLRYCYECMSWLQESNWHDHSSQHLQFWDSRHCEVIIYRHTVIRPGYCPCCLWDQTLAPEERMKSWLHSAGLRGHIERRHIQKMKWPSTKPICGCSDSVESEIEFRRHLHDVHGLTNAIWRRSEPQPAVKRKRGAGAQQKRVGANDEGAAPKKVKFQHYQPLPLDQPVAVEPHSPTAIKLPSHDTAQAGFINQPHADFDHSARVHARASSDSESSMGDISPVTFPLSSARTTPDLYLIDPKLFEPGVSGEDGITMANNVPNTPDDRPSLSNDDEDAGPHDKTVAQSCDHMSSLCISGNACDYEDAGVVEPTASPGRTKLHADLPGVDGGILEDGLPRDDGPAARRARSPFPSTSPVYSAPSSTPKTRGKATPRYCAKSQNTEYISKGDSLLAPRERSALWRLKRENLTWRQIMPHFPEKSVATLRQTWIDMEHSSMQRPMRSQRKTRR